MILFLFLGGVKEVLYYGKLDKSHNRADVFSIDDFNPP